ncbi:MAG: NAD(P)H-hydrate dehydratase [Agarilytica sp.]
MPDAKPEKLPRALYTCEQTRELDSLAISQAEIPGIVLMKRAGRSAFEQLLNKWPSVTYIAVFCGAGNNGGDGYILAGLAAQKYIAVDLYSTVDPSTLNGDAQKAKDFALAQGIEIQTLGGIDDIEGAEGSDGITLPDCPGVVIVDGLLGTGFRGELKASLSTVTKAINASGLPVLALDLPSGLDGDSGAADPNAVNADLTTTFVGVKQGLLTGKGPALCGELSYDNLGIPESIFAQLPATTQRISEVTSFVNRQADAHKTDFGHVLVIGGVLGMGGAVMLAAEAALRSGAGLVTVATRPDHVPAVLARLPEVMVKGLESGVELEPLITRADVIVVGPGLGQTSWSQQLAYFALQSDLPKVVDADALNLLASEDWGDLDLSNCVMTPHPGEAARLLSCSTSEIQANRFDALARIQEKYQSVALLKGAGTLINDGQQTWLANVGNPGMAVAGMGDVLSGVVGALIAQGQRLSEATVNAVCAHGLAGDLAAQDGVVGLKATDVMPHLRRVLNGSN